MTEEVELPWGLPLRVRPAEVIGRAIWTTGVYDLAVSEVLWRLSDPGETAVDAGANIGYMTSLLAARVGPSGVVYAYEPHAGVFAELLANVGLWEGRRSARLRTRQVGLSDSARDAVLVEGPEFERNRGTARVADAAPDAARIQLTTLDQEIGPDVRIGVLKVDVEGHEAPLLRGAHRLLAARAVRDVVYEELSGEESAATSVLRSHRYSVFRILKRVVGPVLARGASRGRFDAFTAQSYLATAEPERAVARLKSRGWRCLRSGAQ